MSNATIEGESLSSKVARFRGNVPSLCKGQHAELIISTVNGSMSLPNNKKWIAQNIASLSATPSTAFTLQGKIVIKDDVLGTELGSKNVSITITPRTAMTLFLTPKAGAIECKYATGAKRGLVSLTITNFFGYSTKAYLPNTAALGTYYTFKGLSSWVSYSVTAETEFELNPQEFIITETITKSAKPTLF
ncbi:MAG: hypothetical protein WCG83_03945 [Candidatus Peregrinibacteria bacterium]